MGHLGPHPHFSTFGVMIAWVVAASWDCGSIFIGGLEVDVGGIDQSFLSSNRFPTLTLLWTLECHHRLEYF